MVIKFDKKAKIAFGFGIVIGMSSFLILKSFYNKDESNNLNESVKNIEVNTTYENNSLAIADKNMEIEAVPIESYEEISDIHVKEETNFEEFVFEENTETKSINIDKSTISDIDKDIGVKENKKEQNYINVFSTVDKFVLPSDMDFIKLGNTNEWFNLSNYLEENLEKTCGIHFYDNYISYNNNINGPTIELYKDIDNDEYVLFLYGILNNEISTEKESKEKIELNNLVLDSLCRSISKNHKELYDIIYEDYEIDSTIPSKYKLIQNVDFKIKAEAMTNYVIYTIKNK